MMCRDERHGDEPLRGWDAAELAAVGGGGLLVAALGVVATWRLLALMLGAG